MENKLDIKSESRERMELRIHAEETLKAVVSWMQAVRPSEWLPPTKDSPIGESETKQLWRDYVDKAGELTKKLWKPAELLVDDLTGFMEECCAKPKNPPESK